MSKCGIMCLFILCVVQQWMVVAFSEFPTFISPISNQKCYQCPPGYRLEGQLDCLVDEDGGITFPNCVPCPDGYYLDSWSLDRQCKPKNDCNMKKNTKVITDGATTHDRVCCCETGYEWQSPSKEYCHKTDNECPACDSPPTPVSPSAVICNCSQMKQPADESKAMSEPEAIKFCPIEYQRGYNSGYNEGKLVGGLIAAGVILGLIAVVSFAFCCYKKKCMCGDLKKDANKQENGTSDPPINGALPEGDVSRSNTSVLCDRSANDFQFIDDTDDSNSNDTEKLERTKLLSEQENVNESQWIKVRRYLKFNLDLKQDFHDFACDVLGFTEAEISDVTFDTRDRQNWIYYAMSKWRLKQGDTATPEALVEGFRRVDLRQHADYIEKWIIGKTGNVNGSAQMKALENSTEVNKQLPGPSSAVDVLGPQPSSDVDAQISEPSSRVNAEAPAILSGSSTGFKAADTEVVSSV